MEARLDFQRILLGTLPSGLHRNLHCNLCTIRWLPPLVLYRLRMQFFSLYILHTHNLLYTYYHQSSFRIFCCMSRSCRIVHMTYLRYIYRNCILDQNSHSLHLEARIRMRPKRKLLISLSYSLNLITRLGYVITAVVSFIAIYWFLSTVKRFIRFKFNKRLQAETVITHKRLF